MRGDAIGSYETANVTANKFDFFLKTDKNYPEFYIEKGMLLGIKRGNNCKINDLVVKKSQKGTFIIKKLEEIDGKDFIGKVVMKVTDLREV